jgi:hypothetical protein
VITRLNRSRLVTVTIVVASALAVALGFVGAVRRGSAQARLVPAVGLPGELAGPAPWPRNVGELGARLSALGLPALEQEGTVLHIHQHLDVFVAGRRVVVPAGVGIDGAERFISPLHTHDTTGIIHVESPTVRTFTLGQFFGVWGVGFTPRCLGGYCTSGAKRLSVYVNGKLVRGDPRRAPLEAHEEIVVAFGTTAQLPRPLPSSFTFPAGL